MTKSVTRKTTINNELGLHARAATKLVEVACGFEADLFLSKDGREVSGKSIMGVLLLTATRGTEIEIRGEGDDAEELVQAIAALIEHNFGEEK